MRSVKFFIIKICILLGVLKGHAQTELEELEEQLLEYLAENAEEELDLGEVSEYLIHLIRSPLDLNKVSKEQLTSLYLLNPIQIYNLLEHRRLSGDYISILELQGVEGFDLELIQLLQHFLKVDNSPTYRDMSVKDIWNESNQEIMLRYGRVIPKQAGYKIDDKERSRFLGSPDRLSLRYRLNYQNSIKIALTMTKDAGEPFFKSAQKYGFDFYSGSISFQDIGRFKNIVLGDYALQLGQGLMLWNGLSFGKGAWATSTTKQGVELKPYTSTNESQFLRGAAARYTLGKIDMISFVSRKKIDGNVVFNDDKKWIVSLPVSGLHRTPNEIENRKTVSQTILGQRVSYSVDRLNLGITWMSTFWDGTVMQGVALRNIFDFQGKELNSLSINYDYTFRNIYLYGETAHSLGGGYATINGLIASLDPKLSLFVNQRYYQKNYWQYYGQAFGETNQLRNEKGLYTGLVYHPTRSINWLVYSDVFRFPWLRYRVDAPSHGVDLFSQFQYIWYKKGKLTFRYRYRLKQENVSIDDYDAAEDPVGDITRHQFRLEFQYKWNDTWTTRTRAEQLIYKKMWSERQNGWMVYQDVFYKPSFLPKIHTNIRVARFITDSYDTRLYAYENDVLYASSFPAYHENGWRTYLNLRYRINRNWDIWGRYATTYLPSEESFGTGLNFISGNKRSEIKLQVRWSL